MFLVVLYSYKYTVTNLNSLSCTYHEEILGLLFLQLSYNPTNMLSSTLTHTYSTNNEINGSCAGAHFIACVWYYIPSHFQQISVTQTILDGGRWLKNKSFCSKKNICFNVKAFCILRFVKKRYLLFIR